jgi:hypothetical protein
MAFSLGSFGSSSSGGLGTMLEQQVGDETDERRKKRMQDMQSLMGSMGDSVLGQQLGRGFEYASRFASSPMATGFRRIFGGS